MGAEDDRNDTTPVAVSASAVDLSGMSNAIAAALTVDVRTDEEILLDELEEALEDIQNAFQANSLTEEVGAFAIDGVGLSSSESPSSISAASSASAVSIVTDNADITVIQGVKESNSSVAPEILSTLRLPNITLDEQLEAIRVNQTERQILKEAVKNTVQVVSNEDPDEKYSIAAENNELDMAALEAKINALSDMQTKANSASLGLDPTSMSESIMENAATLLSSAVTKTESSMDLLPATIDDYIKIWHPDGYFEGDAGENLTNTAKIMILTRDMLLGILTCNPKLLDSTSRPEQENPPSMHIMPSAWQVSLDGMPSTDIKHITTVFDQNPLSILSYIKHTHLGDGQTVGPPNALFDDSRSIPGGLGTISPADSLTDQIAFLINENAYYNIVSKRSSKVEEKSEGIINHMFRNEIIAEQWLLSAS